MPASGHRQDELSRLKNTILNVSVKLSAYRGSSTILPDCYG